MPTDTMIIDSRQAFHEAVQWTLRAADAREARSLCWVDPDFADWPLDDPALLDLLTRWLQRPQRRLVMLAANYEGMARDHARFSAWRPAWSHAVEPRTPGQGLAIDLPTVMLDDGPVSLQLHDRVHWRGRAAVDPVQAHAIREAIDAALQRSEGAWPVRPLGL
jgi:hypothetical protein